MSQQSLLQRKSSLCLVVELEATVETGPVPVTLLPTWVEITCLGSLTTVEVMVWTAG